MTEVIALPEADGWQLKRITGDDDSGYSAYSAYSLDVPGLITAGDTRAKPSASCGRP